MRLPGGALRGAGARLCRARSDSDVEGFDARAKAAILAGIAFDADVVASDVYTEGITAIGAPT